MWVEFKGDNHENIIKSNVYKKTFGCRERKDWDLLNIKLEKPIFHLMTILQ
jgi:hypothetical protein